MVVWFNHDLARNRAVFKEKKRGTLSLELGVVSLETQNAELKTPN